MNILKAYFTDLRNLSRVYEQTWMLNLPPQEVFLAYILSSIDLEGLININNKDHKKHVVAFAIIACSYQSFGDAWIASIVSDDQDVLSKTMHHVAKCSVMAEELTGFGDGEISDLVGSYVIRIRENAYDSGDDVGSWLPYLFSEMLCENIDLGIESLSPAEQAKVYIEKLKSDIDIKFEWLGEKLFERITSLRAIVRNFEKLSF